MSEIITYSVGAITPQIKILWNLVQGTEEWERIRYGKIGGTSSEILLKFTQTKFNELLAEYCEPYEPNYDNFENAAMIRGHELEPHARQALSQYTGVEYLEAGWIESPINPIVGISPDGISADLKRACELKCLGAKKHLEVLQSDEILPEFINQCIHYFTVNPFLEKLDFAAFRPENQYKSLIVRELDLHSEINIGTTAKPKYVLLGDCVTVARIESDLMVERIKQCIEFMKF